MITYKNVQEDEINRDLFSHFIRHQTVIKCWRKENGTSLFRAAREWAKAHGAKKLYISAHSAVESQAFYHRMGCVEAAVYNQAHVEAEPYDCQLECNV